MILSYSSTVHSSVMFFFSSRRRHTRSYGDWSSDVCSSDLFFNLGTSLGSEVPRLKNPKRSSLDSSRACWLRKTARRSYQRSEERRVGKERGSGGGRGQQRKDKRQGMCDCTRSIYLGDKSIA